MVVQVVGLDVLHVRTELDTGILELIAQVCIGSAHVDVNIWRSLLEIMDQKMLNDGLASSWSNRAVHDIMQFHRLQEQAHVQLLKRHPLEVGIHGW